MEESGGIPNIMAALRVFHKKVHEIRSHPSQPQYDVETTDIWQLEQVIFCHTSILTLISVGHNTQNIINHLIHQNKSAILWVALY